MRNFVGAAISTAARWGAVNDNLAQIAVAAEVAAGAGAKLLLTPECSLTGADWPTGARAPAVKTVALRLNSAPVRAVRQIARAFGLTIAVGMYEARGGPGRGRGRERSASANGDDGIRVTQALINRDGVVGVYRKVHEGRRSSTEKDLFPVFDLGFAKVGISVCFDNMFPECARILALKGAEVLLSPFTSLPFSRAAWRNERLVALRARAFDNRLFVLSASHAGPRVKGRPPEWGYSGICCAINPLGEVLGESRGPVGRPQGVAVEMLETERRTYLLAHVPNLRARRPAAYRLLNDEKLQAAYIKNAPAYVYPDRADRTVVTGIPVKKKKTAKGKLPGRQG